MVASASTAHSLTLDTRFLLLETLGRGGQGRVFRAYDRIEGREVAIKVLDSGRDDGPHHALVAEFAAWSRLRHPGVVRAYELGRAFSGPLSAGTPYLVLELMRGRPAHKALPPGHVADVIVEEFTRRVLRALGHVHDAGLVHRDLKPGNILVGSARRGTGRVKLTDFGLASPSGLAGPPGQLSGSLPYVAPEVILGLPVDGRADLYALGVLLYLLTTGRMPIRSASPEQWINWHIDGPSVDPRRIRAAVSPRLAELVSRLTTRDRDARLPSSAEALSLLGPSGRPGAAYASAPLLDGERAALRLALDAARAGELRELALPARAPGRRALRVELEGLAVALDVGFAHLKRPVGARHADLARVVLKLLLDRGDEIARLVERHGLQRGLPLAILGGVPVWDRLDRGDEGARRPAAVPIVARGVAEFVLDSARRRTLVLFVEHGALGDPLAAAVIAHLRRSALKPATPRRGAGGLLLVIDRRVGRPAHPRAVPCHNPGRSARP